MRLLLGIFSVMVAFFALTSCESTRFEKVFKQDTISDYEEFIREHPAGDYKLSAEKRLHELTEENLYLDTKSKGDLESFRGYLAKYPEGAYSFEIINRLIAGEVLRVAKDYEVALAGSGEAKYGITLLNKTGLDITVFGAGKFLFEREIPSSAQETIQTKGYTVLVIKSKIDSFTPVSYCPSPEQGEISVELWLADSPDGRKTVSIFNLTDNAGQ